MEKERKYLEETYDLVDKLILENKENIKNAPKKYSGTKNIAIRDAMLLMYKRQEEKLKRIDEKPYFARIDFKENGEKEEKFYIGKTDIVDKNQIKVVDWRAPIASLYYDNHLGEISYDTINSKIEGVLKLKRQYVIENKELKEYIDVEQWTDDEILKPYLSTSSDIRLKNIVSTIQKEQNDIIRKSLNTNCIVQGVAGSGKTTVALHKIAYLVYTYIDDIKESQYAVIGPNKFFLNYISSVLPDLDVGNAKEFTYEELALEYVSEKLNIEQGVTEHAKYKCSLECKKDIDTFLKEWEEKYTDEINEKINRLNIKPFMDKLENEKILKNKILQVQYSIKSFLEINKEKIISKIKRVYDKKISKEPENKREIYATRNEEIRYLEKELYNNVKKAFKLPTALEVYNKFLEKNNINCIENKKIKSEDLAAIMYIKYRLEGKDTYNDIRHVVVDEAQDFGVFNIYVLKKLFKNSTFSIFGDSAQSIHSYRSMHNLKEIEAVLKDAEMLKLNKSYRTTIEIMAYANKILRHLNMTEANAVIRHGKEVDEIKSECINKDIVNKINENVKDGHKTIAIICNSQKEINDMHKYLESKNISSAKMDKQDLKYETGVCILTPEFAKGLEFDSVIIRDMSEYDKESTIDLKRLYVAITRALHECTALYSKNNIIEEL